MAIEKINDEALLTEGKYHVTQPDVPQKSAQEIKEFFDHIPREVIIPKVNEIVDGVNEALGLDGTGSERNFVTPAVNTQFYDGFYFNATAKMLTEEGMYSSGAEYHLMDVTLENGTVRPIYLRSNFSGSYSVHPEPWTWTTDILADSIGSSYVNMTGYGKVTITAVSKLATKYISLLPALDPSFKFASEQYVNALLPKNYVTKVYKEGNWYCRVWNNGIKECWCSVKKYFDSTRYNSSYADIDIGLVGLPTGFFTSVPAVMATGSGAKVGLPSPLILNVSMAGINFAVHTQEPLSGSIVINVFCIGD